MRTIKHTGRFKRDYRRERAGRFGGALEAMLVRVVDMLLEDQPLPARYVDHALTGDWKDHRDCHLRPDLVLIYRKPDESSPALVRLGSHSELGL